MNVVQSALKWVEAVQGRKEFNVLDIVVRLQRKYVFCLRHKTNDTGNTMTRPQYIVLGFAGTGNRQLQPDGERTAAGGEHAKIIVVLALI